MIRWSKLLAAVTGVILLLAILSQGFYLSATQTDIAAQAPTFRSNARMVLIDVLVRDRQGNPVLGLKPEDFTLSDNGIRQSLVAVEEHQRVLANAVVSQTSPHRDAYTNWVPSPANGAVNIIVLDRLNTTVVDRVRATQQMLKYLRELPPGQQVALFTLGTRLRMVQDFTTKSEALIAAAADFPAASNPLSPSSGDVFSADDLTARPETMDVRVAYTLNALKDLGRTTASLPGRKNVIWLTAGFPIRMDEPDRRLAKAGLIRERDYGDQVRQVAAMLATMQVALYPVDVVGLQTEAEIGPNRENLLNQRDALIALAQETGGSAHYDNNDVAEAIRRVLTNDSKYYTLAYTPQNVKWDGSYHRVSVKVAMNGVETTHRRGYYAIGESPLNEKEASRSLGDALDADVLDSRMIVLGANVSQPETPGRPLELQCTIDPNTVVFDSRADGSKTAALALAAAVWDAKKHKVADIAKKVHPTLTPEQLVTAKTAGIPWALKLKLHPGAYTLKLAVVDLNSGRTGSMTMPLKVSARPQS